jgi:hypothetical protein
MATNRINILDSRNYGEDTCDFDERWAEWLQAEVTRLYGDADDPESIEVDVQLGHGVSRCVQATGWGGHSDEMEIEEELMAAIGKRLWEKFCRQDGGLA